jgi:hypothetical protein
MFVAATMMELIEHQNKEHGHVDSNNHVDVSCSHQF